jgi:hypothetical protein
MRFSDGSHFTGNFIADQRYGQGIEVRGDGTQFEGSWVADKREGVFIMTEKNGDSMELRFSRDRLDE